MPQRTVVIGSRSGLHARPAALLVQAATRQPVRVTIAREGGAPVDAGSLLSVLALGAGAGESVVLAAEGEGAEAAVAELAALVAQDLDAPAAEAADPQPAPTAAGDAKE
ncbi:HPr family phosphocarrier protein [Streptomyces sp. DSM 44917]|uniref:Phosphocarrier protein HPr n=1 Tax=Streptomyces boetiae TaxID=3075541 RepID=A0ABU2LEV3_9ACTN|nr:HPr family phosphocarrier protein [Streptomyces sp. DSM 44917]MDT0310113.1 HPr family phosphocarrier protein [Streptomyces sp. DSM 44917]